MPCIRLGVGHQPPEMGSVQILHSGLTARAKLPVVCGADGVGHFNDGTRQSHPLKQREVDVHVQGLRFEAGEAAGDGDRPEQPHFAGVLKDLVNREMVFEDGRLVESTELGVVVAFFASWEYQA